MGQTNARIALPAHCCQIEPTQTLRWGTCYLNRGPWGERRLNPPVPWMAPAGWRPQELESYPAPSASTGRPACEAGSRKRRSPVSTTPPSCTASAA